MTDTSSMLFEIADTFSMEVTQKRGPSAGALSGNERVSWPVMQGLDWQIKPAIVDSGYYEGNEKAGALLHVTGSLYLLLLIDAVKLDKDYAHLWVIDGAKLDWAKRSTLLVFPSLWKRRDLYEAVQDGVVAGFRRSRKGVPWEPVEEAKQKMMDYVQSKLHVVPAVEPDEETDAQKVVRKLRDDMNSMSYKFRTKGPRGY